jgi:post-segregation antitoxin (ccd killing protein)
LLVASVAVWVRGYIAMRATLSLDDQLLTAARHRALDENVSLSRIVENALRKALAEPRDTASAVHLVTAGGTGVRPGVNLDNTASLSDIMENLS